MIARRWLKVALVVFASVFPVFSGCNGAHAQTKPEWIRQMGTGYYEWATDVATDPNGNVYVVGNTDLGGVDGNANAGMGDFFLVKYSSAGVKQWTRQLGTSGWDRAGGIAVDPNGNVYVAGSAGGGLDGNTSAGDSDLFLVKYSSAGVKQWTRQLGTSGWDGATDVAVDASGYVYVAGETQGGLDGNTSAGNGDRFERDLFLVKYSSAGVKQWTRQLGTSSWDGANGVAVDASGYVYVTGETQGGLDGNTSAGGRDLFLIKFSGAGVKQWTRQLGSTEGDGADAVAVDPNGNVYVAGSTGGGLAGNTSAGGSDLFLVKYSSAGVKLWTRQMGTRKRDSATGLAVDGAGNAYVTGFTEFSLDGITYEGYSDIFVVKFSSQGIAQWTRQLGTSSREDAEIVGGDISKTVSIALDASRNVYLAGVTAGVFDGNMSAGAFDLFLVKYRGSLEWTRGIGTIYDEYATDIAVDRGGNVFVTGSADGGLDGNINAGSYDLFLVKYNRPGDKQWSRQLGTIAEDKALGVDVDAGGNVYVAGETWGGLDGNLNAGNSDLFLAKYDGAGVKQWTRQLGTSSSESASGVAVDPNGNVYVAGSTGGGLDGNSSAGGGDFFLVKYNSAGVKQWTRQLGTNGTEAANGVAVDPNENVYVAGSTDGGLDGNASSGGGDLFLVKYSSAGVKQWTRQLGTSGWDGATGVAVDPNGDVYVAGYTYGGLDGNASSGSSDLFLVKYSSAGVKQWTRQLGTSSAEGASAVTADGLGNVYVAGSTYGGLEGNINGGTYDIFIARYGGAGDKQWLQQLSSNLWDIAEGVAANEAGDVYLLGNEGKPIPGDIGNGPPDRRDAVLYKFSTGDDTAPPSGSVAIDGGATLTNAAPDGKSVSLTLTCADPGGCRSMQFSNNGTIWTAEESLASTKTWDIINTSYGGTAANGTKTVYVRYMDNTGNWSGAFSDTIVYDTAAPQGTIAINNNPAPDRTGNTLVLLNLKATDVNGVTEVQLSNNGTQWSLYPFADTLGWILSSGTGSKTVWVRFKDTAGNWSSAISDSTYLDAVAPVTTATPPGATGLGEPVSVQLKCADDSDAAGLGCNGTTYRLNGGAWAKYTGPITIQDAAKLEFYSADVLGNQESVKAETYGFSPLATKLSILLSSQTIKQTDTVDISGSLTELSPAAINLQGLTVSLTVKPPSGTPVTHTTTTDSASGHYLFRGIGGFSLKGTYALQAHFAGTGLLQPADSSAEALLSGNSAGYALIVEGRILSDTEGLKSHNKTTNRVYDYLLKRGFAASNIHYYNYLGGQPGVDGAPAKADLRQALTETIKGKMNAVPAPLWVVLVDHGSPGKFHVDGGSATPAENEITAAELDGWLDGLEAALNTEARRERRIVVIGSCYSGSFVEALRQGPSAGNGGRVVVASAAAMEESYKGSQEPDGVRSGEFFVEELFKGLVKGESLRAAFVQATADTESFTGQGSGSANAQSQFGDSAAQHPLLEDDGVGSGSNQLSDETGDGVAAAQVYLGVGLTNSAANPADLVAVTPTRYLNATTVQTQLWAEPDVHEYVDTAWVEVKAPTTVLRGQGGSEQLELEIPRVFLGPNDMLGRWEQTYGTDCAGRGCFNVPGRYDVYYFTLNKYTEEISQMLRSSVYKNWAGNPVPGAFSLLAPANGSTQGTVLLLDWADSLDPSCVAPGCVPPAGVSAQGSAVTYTVLISRNAAFDPVDYQLEELPNSEAAILAEAGLADLSTYYWKVLAVDAYGATRESSQVWSFKTDDTNSEGGGFVRGCVTDSVTGAKVSGLSVSASGSVSISSNCYSVYGKPGTVSVTAGASGYSSKTVSATIPSGTETRLNIALVPKATPKYLLTVQAGGNGEGTVGGGGSYTSGTTVNITAAPKAHMEFTWSGDCAGAASPLGVLVDRNKTCTAIFKEKRHALTVSRSGNGTGAVTSTPAAISCGTGCAATFLEGTKLSLSATAGADSLFVGWSGACGGTGGCAVTMDGARSVKARFMATMQELTLARSGEGEIEADPGPIAWEGNAGRGSYAYDTSVTLTAKAATGWYFDGWAGSCRGMAPECTVRMNEALSATAKFTATIQELRIEVQGAGSGEMRVEPGPLSWTGNIGTGRHPYGTAVILTAQADGGTVFGGWTGACGGADASCTLNMTEPRQVGAIFAPEGAGLVEVSGTQLLVGGEPYTVKGVVYTPVPIGEDPEMPPYGDYFTWGYLDLYGRDLAVVRGMNMNTVRLLQWDGTADHTDFLDRAYNGGTNTIRVIAGFRVSPGLEIDPDVPGNDRADLVATFRAMVAAHKDHPAILMWAIGEGLNGPGMYGGSAAARHDLFSLIDEMAAAAHAEDKRHPVTAVLADNDLEATIGAFEATVPNLDLWGAIVHRGGSFGELFEEYAKASGKPLVILGYGVDAYDSAAGGEGAVDEGAQAGAAAALWGEIEANLDVCAGGTIAEYSDQWWKGQLAEPPCGDAGTQDLCGVPATGMPDGYDNAEWWGLVGLGDGDMGADGVNEREVCGTLRGLFWSPRSALVINGGARFTGSRAAMLAIAAPATAQWMCLSNTGSCQAKSWEPVADTKPWTLTAGGGTKRVSAWFADAAGQIITPEPASDTIELDASPPVNGKVTVTAGVTQLTVSWEKFADPSGIRSYHLVFATRGAPASCAAGMPLYTGAERSFTHRGLTNTTYYYRVCATDRIGNRSKGLTGNGRPLAETRPPTGTVQIKGGGGWTKSATVELALTATDESVPIQMCLNNTGLACTKWIPFAAAKGWTLAGGDGPKTVYAWFRDAWGNPSPTPTAYRDTISLDTVKPANGTLTATPGPGQIVLTWQDFKEDPSEKASGIEKFRVVWAKGTAPATCASGNLAYEGAGVSYVHQNLINQKYAYRVCAIDGAGNVSTGVATSATPQPKETEPPEGTVKINGGDLWTRSAAVTLALTATDESGPVRMCLNNTGLKCTQWIPSVATKGWTLAGGDGPKTVYAWFRDAWGNTTPETTPHTATIGLDTVKPANGTLTATPGPGKIVLVWEDYKEDSSAKASGIDRYLVVWAKGSAPASCVNVAQASLIYEGPDTSYTHTGLINQTYGYRVCAIDKANNVSSGVSRIVKPLP